jgi:hypothetical protein
MPHSLILLVVAVAIANGLFSPVLLPIFALQGIWYPYFLPASLPLILLLSSLLVSTLTLMLAGVPAALYERRADNSKSSRTSGLIWLAAAVLLALPALPNLVKAIGL